MILERDAHLIRNENYNLRYEIVCQRLPVVWQE